MIDTVLQLATLHRHFACAHLSRPCLLGSDVPTFPRRSRPWLLTTNGSIAPRRCRGSCSPSKRRAVPHRRLIHRSRCQLLRARLAAQGQVRRSPERRARVSLVCWLEVERAQSFTLEILGRPSRPTSSPGTIPSQLRVPVRQASLRDRFATAAQDASIHVTKRCAPLSASPAHFH